jgi:hypothetical protein
MHLTMTSSEMAVPIDQYTQILKLCRAEEPTTGFTQSRTNSLKLDLRAIQEVEAMEGYATEEDFDELLFVPKVQDFLSKVRHNDQEKQAFWLLLRIRYLALLRRPERAQVIRANDQIRCKMTLLLAEIFRLPKVAERIRLLSRLPYQDFAALMIETDQRELALNADGGVFLSSIAFDKQNSEIRQTARRTFLAR